MRRTIFSLLLVVMAMPALGQTSYDNILAEIEANSTKLAASREQIEAQRLSARTGLLPENPEVEFGYGWGRPTEIGTKKELAVTQTVDFPTAYFFRSKIARLSDASAETQLRARRMELLLEAKRLCIEITYRNAMIKEYSERVEKASEVSEIYRAKFDVGQVGTLDVRKANMEHVAARNKLRTLTIERDELLLELAALNGGKRIELTAVDFPAVTLPEDFEEWYEQAEAANPTLASLHSQTEIARRQVKLDRALTLPKITAGYAGEKTADEEFNGFTVGVSLPLWGGRNTVRTAKAQMRAAEAEAADFATELYGRLRSLWSSAMQWRATAEELYDGLDDNDLKHHLSKALEAGEISQLDYLVETAYYYDAIEAALDSRRQYSLVVAELRAFEL